MSKKPQVEPGDVPSHTPKGVDIMRDIPSRDNGDAPTMRFIRWHTTDRRHLKAFSVPALPRQR